MTKALLFVKHDCPGCQFVQDSIKNLHDKAAQDRIERDMAVYESETVDGLAEGCFNDVKSFPTFIVKDGNDTLCRVDGDYEAIAEKLAQWAKGQDFS